MDDESIDLHRLVAALHVNGFDSPMPRYSIEIIVAGPKSINASETRPRILEPIVAKEQTANYTPRCRHRHAA
jgi:hypothetical protein